MDKELTIIAEPEELIAWADTFDILLNPSIEDAAILLNYMEGHDYAIGIDSAGAVENLQISVYLAAGNRENIKITTPFDLKIAAALLDSCLI